MRILPGSYWRHEAAEFLVLPSCWGLMLASPTIIPSIPMFAYLCWGTYFATCGGCIVNDIVDQDIDKKVSRTKNRPLCAGTISTEKAMAFAAFIGAMNLTVLFMLPWEAAKYGLYISAPVAFLYPFMKRFFPSPQFFLGFGTNSGVFVGYAALAASFAVDWSICLPFYFGGIMWTMVFDSFNGYQDYHDDKKLGVHSNPVLFEKAPKFYLGLCAAMSIASFLVGGINAGLGSGFYVALAAMSGHFYW